jgi:hypothetical protein
VRDRPHARDEKGKSIVGTKCRTRGYFWSGIDRTELYLRAHTNLTPIVIFESLVGLVGLCSILK